jgi:hypothetical protein
MKNPTTALPDRITQVLDGRKIYPWAKAIGISKGSIEAIMKLGGMPGADVLTALRRSENVRLEWILEGRGSPFAVTVCATDAEAAELLVDMTRTETWSLTVVWDTSRVALVLEQPGSYGVKDGKDDKDRQLYREVPYRIADILVGRVGIGAITIARALAGEGDVGLVIVESVVMTLLQRGELGTYRIWDAPDALMAKRQRIDDKHPILSEFIHQMPTLETKDEVELVTYYRSMSPENKVAVNQVASAMADYAAAAVDPDKNPPK